jgi:hypothetical protein
VPRRFPIQNARIMQRRPTIVPVTPPAIATVEELPVHECVGEAKGKEVIVVAREEEAVLEEAIVESVEMKYQT